MFSPVVSAPCVPTHSSSSFRLVLGPFSSLFGGTGHFPKETRVILLLKVVEEAKSSSQRHEGREGSWCQLCSSVAVSQGQSSKSSMIWLPWKLRIRIPTPLPAVTLQWWQCKPRELLFLRSRLPFANLGKFLAHLHQIWNEFALVYLFHHFKENCMLAFLYSLHQNGPSCSIKNLDRFFFQFFCIIKALACKTAGTHSGFKQLQKFRLSFFILTGQRKPSSCHLITARSL